MKTLVTLVCSLAVSACALPAAGLAATAGFHW